MFEHRQEQMEALMKENIEFRKMYSDHQQIEKRVTAAENGTAPMEDLALNQLKREKLQIKDQLNRMMEQSQAA
ncbi:MAG: YdcH family protein [Pseudomonadota bacterium]